MYIICLPIKPLRVYTGKETATEDSPVASLGSIGLGSGLAHLMESIPKMQAVGSAYANLATQFAAAIPQVILALVVFKFRVNYRFIISLVLFVAGVTAFNYFSRLLPMIWYVNFMFMVLSSIVVASLLRLFNIQSLIAILKDR